jgi:uncharacterized protein YdeI (YjbR/CyaY-like superfamily)
MAQADVPIDINTALAADTAAKAVFEGLPPSHRREYLDWVAEARRAEARERRTLAMMARLKGLRTKRGDGEG